MDESRSEILEVSLDGGKSFMPLPASALHFRVTLAKDGTEWRPVLFVGQLTTKTISVQDDPYADDVVRSLKNL